LFGLEQKGIFLYAEQEGKMMEQEERLDYLIGYLQKHGSALRLPEAKTLEEKKTYFRALMNVWKVQPLTEEFLNIQDRYLQEELKSKPVRKMQDLIPVQKNLFVWQGDITLLAADAVVNAANKSLLGCFLPLHKCIDNAVHSFAGLQLRAKCFEIMQAQGREEETGQAKITPAYNLPSRYVIHTVGPIVGQKLTAQDEALLCSCYRSCMRCAAEQGLTSIAFCCISTGEFHFPNQRAGELAVQTVKACQREFARDMNVVFNVYKDIDMDIYIELLRE